MKFVTKTMFNGQEFDTPFLVENNPGTVKLTIGDPSWGLVKTFEGIEKKAFEIVLKEWGEAKPASYNFGDVQMDNNMIKFQQAQIQFVNSVCPKLILAILTDSIEFPEPVAKAPVPQVEQVVQTVQTPAIQVDNTPPFEVNQEPAGKPEPVAIPQQQVPMQVVEQETLPSSSAMEAQSVNDAYLQHQASVNVQPQQPAVQTPAAPQVPHVPHQQQTQQPVASQAPGVVMPMVPGQK